MTSTISLNGPICCHNFPKQQNALSSQEQLQKHVHDQHPLPGCQQSHRIAFKISSKADNDQECVNCDFHQCFPSPLLAYEDE